MKKSYRTPEVEIVARLSRELEQTGWECGHEVRVPGRTGSLDLCAYRTDEQGMDTTMAVEAKPIANLEVYSQALRWREDSTYITVAVDRIPEGVALACLWFFTRAGIGLWHRDRFVYEPKKLSADSDCVKQLADAARKSSRGIVQPGGGRSPIAVKKPHLLAERVVTFMQFHGLTGDSMGTILPDVEAKERDGAAKVLNDNRSLGYWAKRSGTDWIIYAR